MLAPLLASGSLCVAHAEEPSAGQGFKFSGFLSIVGGKILSGQETTPASSPLVDPWPAYIADWANAGIYQGDFTLEPESRAGAQVDYSFNKSARLTVQVVTRGTDPRPNLQWAYGSYKFDNGFELQVGRKRIPLYYYSDFQDIGISYPWIAPPPELYGWDATNYNGASLRYGGYSGDVTYNASVFGGREHIGKDLYWEIYSTDRNSVTWNNLWGADLDVSVGPWTVRGVYLRADVTTDDSTDSQQSNYARLSAYGLAVNLDMGKWFVLSEITQTRRDFTRVPAPYYYRAPAFTIGAGWHFGKWTPFVNLAQYRESTNSPAQWTTTDTQRASITLRYDWTSQSAFKLQMDRQRDESQNSGGNLTLLRASYDMVF
jgi:hypothetical protein